MRRVLVALFATTLLSGLLPGQALMATVTHIFGGGVDGKVTCAYSYDDVTKVMTSIILNNQDTNAHLVTGSALDPVTFAVVASGTVSLAAQSTQTFDITVLGLLMVSHIAKDGTTYLSPPYILSCAIS